METSIRTIAKAVTWQATGLVTTGALAWLHTGSMLDAVSFALSTAFVGMTFFVVHERLWDRINWGRKHQQARVTVEREPVRGSSGNGR